MIIRDATPADLPAITDIYRFQVENFCASYETAAPDLAEMTRRYDGMIRRGLPYLVAEDGGEVIGYAYGNLFKERLAYRFMLEDSIYVSDRVQKGGVGTALLTQLLARCERDGYRQMLAVIGDAERSLGSIAVHRKLGFVECGRFTGSGFKFGRWLDTLIMQKQLGPGRSTLPDGSTPADRLTL